MKRKRLCLLLAVFWACASSMFSQVKLDKDHFPDDNFRAALSVILGVAEGEVISAEKISKTEKLGEDAKLNDKDFSAGGIKGIENFKNLKYLRVYNGKLSSVDLSENTQLTYLYLGTNNLTELDVSALTELTELYCNNNQLTKLNISNNKKLYKFECYDNKSLTELEGLGNMEKLEKLWCYSCGFTDKTLDLSYLNNLTEVVCNNCGLAALKLPQGDNNLLNELKCTDNKLETLDISKNTNLDTLYCFNNIKLTTLNTSNNPKLKDLQLNDTGIKTVDLKNNTKLETLYCFSNKMEKLDISNNTALKDLKCHNNLLTELSLENHTQLETLYCGTNQIKSLDFSNKENLRWLECQSNPLGEISVSTNGNLYHFVCTDTGISSLDVSNNKNLNWLDCDHNTLTSLDVSNNTALTHLSCFENGISSLDVTNLTELKDLKCSHNHLTSLNLSGKNLSDACEIANQDLTQVVEVVDRKSIGIPVAPGMKKENVSNLTIDNIDITDFDVKTVGNKTYLVIYQTPKTDMDLCDVNKVVRYDYVSGYSDKKMDVTIHTGPYVMRIPTKEGYGTLCIGYNSKVPENTKCYYATKIEGDNETMNLVLTEITGGYVPANTPILVKSLTSTDPDENVIGEMYAFYKVEGESAAMPVINGNILAGSANGNIPVQPKTVLTLGYGNMCGDLGFWRYTGSSVAMHRAYVPATQVPSNAKGVVFVFDNGNAGGDVTAISGVTSGDITGKDAAYYTLQGMKLGARPSRKGVYVVNGRKVVVK